MMIPFAGYRGCYEGNVYSVGDYASLWSSSLDDDNIARDFYLDADSLEVKDNVRANGDSVRCFKNSYIEPPKTLNLFFMSDGEEV